MFYVCWPCAPRCASAAYFADGANPASTELLDLVALGTVADVVRLDDNNRILVAQGLRRMRAGKASPGIVGLVARRRPRPAPRFHLRPGLRRRTAPECRRAADDMALGIACLPADDAVSAQELAPASMK